MQVKVQFSPINLVNGKKIILNDETEYLIQNDTATIEWHNGLGFKPPTVEGYIVDAVIQRKNKIFVYYQKSDDIDGIYSADEETLTLNGNQFKVKDKGISIQQLSNDVTNIINSKLDENDVGRVAITNNYTDLSNKPTIPVVNNSASAIQPNGEKSAGTSTTVARADHVHQSDVYKASVYHTHGIIDKDGYVVGKLANKNLATDENGNIIAEDKISVSNIGANITVEKTTGGDFLAQYVIKQNGVAVGPPISVPKDFVIKNGYTASGSSIGNKTGIISTHKYLVLVVNTYEDDGIDKELYVDVEDLFHEYEAGDCLVLSGNVFKHREYAAINSGTNSSKTINFGDTFQIPKVNVDKWGHVTSINQLTATTPSLGTGVNNAAAGNHGHGSINNAGIITATTSSGSVNKVLVTDGSNNIKVIDKLPATNVTHQDISGKINISDIENSLSSTATNKPLSAAQGKWLYENKINKSDIANDLSTDSATKVLSAKQGKQLQTDKINKSDIADNLTTDSSTKVLSAKQGKKLNTDKINYSDIIDNITSTATNKPLSASQGNELRKSIAGKAPLTHTHSKSDIPGVEWKTATPLITSRGESIGTLYYNDYSIFIKFDGTITGLTKNTSNSFKNIIPENYKAPCYITAPSGTLNNNAKISVNGRDIYLLSYGIPDTTMYLRTGIYYPRL